MAYNQIPSYAGLPKAIDQISSLIALGIKAELVVIGGTGLNYPTHQFIRPIRIKGLDVIKGEKFIHKLTRVDKTAKVFKELITSSDQQDIIYMRYPHPLMYSLSNYLNMNKSCKILLEHNIIEPNEYRLTHDYNSLILDYFVGNQWRRQSDGFVCVTEDISKYELKRVGNQFKPHITIGNGIIVSSVKLRKPADFTGDNLDLLCVGNIKKWDGYDRLIKGIAKYKGNTKVRMHIVGAGSEVPNLQKLASDYKLEGVLKFYGFLTGKALDEMFDRCHIAVGTLGMHRVGMAQASVLRIRNYCARGMPFLHGTLDPDFPDGYPYLLNIPQNEAAVKIETITNFLNEIGSSTQDFRDMREYATKNLDWSVKMAKFSRFCQSILDNDYSADINP